MWGGVRKCVGVWGEVWKSGGVGKYGEVWESVLGVGESEKRCGKVCWGVGK